MPSFLAASTRCPLFCLLALHALIAHAQTTAESPTVLEGFEVRDRSTDLVGQADSASEGAVGSSQLDTRPFLRRGELLEVIPGVVITQHSGGGKANQYFLRGFNLDHGTDFSLSVDDMPINMRTHAHGQGYADLNFLIPELVQDITYNKGPFFAEVGDFSAAGSAQFHLSKGLSSGLVSVTYGDGNFARVVIADSIHRQASTTTYGLEMGYDDGPWDLAEHFKRFSGMVRQHWEAGDEQFDLTAMLYHAKWRSTDQVPLRAITSGLIDRFGNIDPTDQGETDRDSLSFNYSLNHGDSVTHVTGYAIYYQLSLYSDFTYFLDNPIEGDQFNQRDRRYVIGGTVDHSWSGTLLGSKSETKVGLQVRDDIIPEVALFHTSRAQYISTVSNDDVNEGSAGLFAQNQVRWTDWFRTDGGLRADAYSFDVASNLPANSGKRMAAIVSPKLSLVFGPWAKTEYYIDGGTGFHSNDARGVTLHEDPSNGEAINPASPLVRSRGLEVGARTSAVKGLVSSVSVWALDLDSELVFSGDSGGTEPSGATRRYGVEFSNFYKAFEWLTLDGDLSFTHARYRQEVPDGGNQVANSIGTVFTGGVVVETPMGFYATLRARYFGPQPIIETGTITEPSSLTYNLRLGYRSRKWEVSLDVLNLFDRKNDDIAYDYTSRLPGEAAQGIDDVHVHPAEPREFRATFTRRF